MQRFLPRPPGEKGPPRGGGRGGQGGGRGRGGRGGRGGKFLKRFQSHSLPKEYNLILNISQPPLWLFISFSLFSNLGRLP